MFLPLYLSYALFHISNAHDECETVNNENPVNYQLETFRQCHLRGPIGTLTTSAGEPVDITDTNTLNTNLLTNNFLLDSLNGIESERIPERVVHAKGAGAFGYFEVIDDITDICKADIFSKVGKKTPLTARFSPSNQDRGGADPVEDSRGCGFKFYTDEGNFDLVGFHTPVYFYKDPIVFAQLVHALRRNPATHIVDPTAKWDIIVLRPENLHEFLWLASDFGVPNGYRHMQCFGIHTYEVENRKGESYFIRFNFTTDQGIENLNREEATRIRSVDPDYFVRDLYNSIANKDYPSWTLYIDVMTRDDIKHANFDPFDVTRTWSRGSYKQFRVGRLVLNRNPKNFFSEVEQLALNPGNLVPGIVGPPDKLFQGRILAYRGTQNHRVGFNHNKIIINQPIYAKTYNRDGRAPLLDNMKDSPNYYPNSFNGLEPTIDRNKPKERLVILESSAVDLGPASEFYTHVLNKAQRSRLVNNLVADIVRIVPSVQKRVVDLLTDVHPELGHRVAFGLGNANITAIKPQRNSILYPPVY